MEQKLLENAYLDENHEQPDRPPAVRIKTSLDTYAADRSDPEPISSAMELQDVEPVQVQDTM